MRAADQHKDPERRIVDDPYARHFLGPAASAALLAVERSGRLGDLVGRHAPGLTTFVQARHRRIDDALCAALVRKRPAVEQVLVLGAGYDMRAQRMGKPLSGRLVFEVDHPATASRKARILDRLERAHLLPAPRAIAVAVDFQHESLSERLVASGFRRHRVTFVIWEGVTMYLSRPAVEETLRSLVELGAPGSEIAFDCWYLLDEPDLASSAHRLSAQALSLLGEPILFGIHPDDLCPFLARLGLDRVEVARAAELQERYVRDGRSVYPASYVACARIRGRVPRPRGMPHQATR